MKENTEGAKLYFDAINRQGGVHGQSVELISVDDQFDPAKTVEVARPHHAPACAGPVPEPGTPHAQALLPLLSEHHVPLVALAPAPWPCTSQSTLGVQCARAITSARPSGGGAFW